MIQSQWKKWGILFPIVYLIDWIDGDNGFEEEAYKYADEHFEKEPYEYIFDSPPVPITAEWIPFPKE